MKRYLSLLILWCSLEQSAYAITITETVVMCEPELIARLHETDRPDVFRTALYVNCTTFSGDQQIVRPQREYDITNRLTPQQLQGLTTLLRKTREFVSINEVIPTPQPTKGAQP